ncbi:MAG: PQQ-binding-like beta-propeller repeat protein [Kiritimatiellaeota bacterium]|nr:PQQ-binding-like beta-propeller repeat protein [Kiritimatiellota bacterium]
MSRVSFELRSSPRRISALLCGFLFSATSLHSTASVTVLNSCVDAGGVRLTWGGGVEEKELRAVSTAGRKAIRIRGRVTAGKGNVYLGARFPIPTTDLRNRRLLVTVASPEPETTRALYVRFYDSNGNRCGSWVNWRRPFKDAKPRTFTLHPAYMSSGFTYERSVVKTDPAAVTAVEIIVGAPSGESGRILAADIAEIAFDPTPLTSLVELSDPKRLVLDTPLVEDGRAASTLFVPPGPTYAAVAAKLVAAVVERTGVRLPIRIAPLEWRPAVPTTHAIVLGDLNSNGLAARLYSLGYTVADAFYPGRGGYVVRTIHDPWGTGRNVILLGGAGPVELDAAADEFVKLLPRKAPFVVPRTFRFVPGKSLVQQYKWMTQRPAKNYVAQQVAAGRRNLERGRHTGVFGTIATMGERYLQTGFEEYARAFVELLFLAAEFRDGDPKTYGGPWGMDSDFTAYRVFPGWDNVEESPTLDDADRLRATRILARWITEAVAPKARGSREPPRVRHNHKTFPALGCWYAGRYAAAFYPSALEGRVWLERAQTCFEIQALAFKPQEDCNGYQWLTLGHMIEYALAARDDTFFRNGNAALVADYAILTMDNFGYQTPYGDTGSFKCWFSELPVLRKAAWYYDVFGTAVQRRNAAEYQWALDKKAEVTGVRRLKEYARAIPSSLPERLLGARAWPLEPLYYKTFPDKNAPPLEQCVDKVLMRNGFDLSDPYLLLDGLNNGGHKHYDGNTISRITALGRIWLADNDYYKSQPKFHNGVLVFRNGQGQTPPPYCELVRCTDLPGVGLSQTVLRRYAGVDWRRSIFWVKSAGLFFVADDFRALEEADYTFQVRWHGVGRARLLLNGLELEQEGVCFRIQAATDSAMDLEDNPELGANWKGYPFAEPMVRDFTEIVRARLEGGSSARAANLLSASPLTNPGFAVRRTETSGIFVIDGLAGPAVLGLSTAWGDDDAGPGDETADSDGLLAFRGTALWLTEDRVAGVGITELRIADFHVAASAPVDFDLPTPGDAGVLSCEVRTRLRFGGDTDPGVLVDGRPGRNDPRRGEIVFELDPGRHTLSVIDSPAAMLGDAAARIAAGARPARRLPPQRPKPLGSSRFKPLWTWRTPQPIYLLTGNRKRPEAVDAGASIRVDPPPRPTNVFGDTPNSIRALCDGDRRTSGGSTQWDPEQTVTLTVSFPDPVAVDRIVLWHWYAERSSKLRKFQLATLEAEVGIDGSGRALRKLGRLVDTAAHGDWGKPGYGPEKYEIVGDGKPAKIVRLRITPRPGAGVYIAELEIWGRGKRLRPVPGQSSLPVFPLQALAAARLGNGADHVFAGGRDGRTVLLRPDGTTAWQQKLPKTVYAVAAADLDGDGSPEFMAGGADAVVHCYDRAGRELWQARPERYKSIPVVRVLLTPTVDNAGRRIVVAGADNWRYTAFDAAGKLLWHCESVHRSTAGATPDLNGDGIQEVFCGTEYYWWPAVRSTDGKKLWSYSTRTGPKANVVAAGDLDGDGKQEVVVGGADGNLHALDDNGKLLWLYNTGDEVSAVLCMDLDGDGRDEVVAASLGFDVVAVDGSGKRLWRLDTGAPVTALCALHKPELRFVFAGQDGVVGAVDAQGRFLGEIGLGTSVTAMITARSAAGADVAVTATTDGRILALSLVPVQQP